MSADRSVEQKPRSRTLEAYALLGRAHIADPVAARVVKLTDIIQALKLARKLAREVGAIHLTDTISHSINLAEARRRGEGA